MTSETLKEVVQELSGCCYPYGDTLMDKRSSYNLGLKQNLVIFLLEEIEEASQLKDRPEYSIKEISSNAFNFLLDTRNWLNEVLENLE